MAIADASVTTSAFVATDSLHGPGLRWWGEAHRSTEMIYAPTILLTEVAGAIRRLTGDARKAQEALLSLSSDRKFHFVDSDLSLCTRAAEIAAAVGLRGCDALYVALAERLGEPLVTFDREQLERAAGVITVTRPTTT